MSVWRYFDGKLILPDEMTDVTKECACAEEKPCQYHADRAYEMVLEIRILRHMLVRAADVLLTYGLGAQTWNPLQLEGEIRKYVPRA